MYVIAASVHKTHGLFILHVDGTNRLHLKITPTLDEPPSVEDYHVPIFTCTKEDIEDIAWDLTIEQVCIPVLAEMRNIPKPYFCQEPASSAGKNVSDSFLNERRLGNRTTYL